MSEAELREHFSEQIERRQTVELQGGKARGILREQLGAIVLGTSTTTHLDGEAVTTALVEAVRAHGLASLPWTEDARLLQQQGAIVPGLAQFAEQ